MTRETDIWDSLERFLSGSLTQLEADVVVAKAEDAGLRATYLLGMTNAFAAVIQWAQAERRKGMVKR